MFHWSYWTSVTPNHTPQLITTHLLWSLIYFLPIAWAAFGEHFFLWYFNTHTHTRTQIKTCHPFHTCPYEVSQPQPVGSLAHANFMPKGSKKQQRNSRLHISTPNVPSLSTPVPWQVRQNQVNHTWNEKFPWWQIIALVYMQAENRKQEETAWSIDKRACWSLTSPSTGVGQ